MNNKFLIDTFFSNLDKIDSREKIKQNLELISMKFNLQNFINHNIENFINHKYTLPLNSNYNRILLGKNNEFNLNLVFRFENKNTSNFLYSVDSESFITAIYSENIIKYKLYKQINCDISLFNNKLVLNDVYENELKLYNCLRLDKFINVIDFTSNNFSCFLVLNSNHISNYLWEYDKKTLIPTKLISSNMFVNRLITSTKILGEIGNEESINLLTYLCKNEFHNIRWEAINQLINHDFEKGIEILKNMTQDKHPDIVNAAKKSLIILNKS